MRAKHPLALYYRKFNQELEVLSKVSDFFWKSLFATLPRKAPFTTVKQQVTEVGSVNLRTDTDKTRDVGPKFFAHPRLDKVEILALVRLVASKEGLEEEAKGRILELGRSLPNFTEDRKNAGITRFLTSVCGEDFKLVRADKEGNFVVLSSEANYEISRCAYNGNFRDIPRFNL